MKLTLKAPKSKHLKLEHDKLLSNFGFNFNLRRYNMGIALFRSDPLTLSMLDTWWDVGENLTLAQQTFDEKVVPARKKDIERLGQENNARHLIYRIIQLPLTDSNGRV
jgi:hypothetical protein